MEFGNLPALRGTFTHGLRWPAISLVMVGKVLEFQGSWAEAGVESYHSLSQSLNLQS